MTPDRIISLFDCPVGVGVSDPRRPSGFLYPEEMIHVTQAVPKRRMEFTAGRTAAREALSALGGPLVPILPDADRVPQWPRGYAGSITHCDDLCLAAVTRAARALGLDVEDDSDLPDDLWDEILLPEERAAVLATQNPGQMAKLVFSAKEAAYKAQFPISRTLYGFHDMQVTWDRAGQFVARFRIAAGPFRPGNALDGRFAIDSGHIVTAVTLA